MMPRRRVLHGGTRAARTRPATSHLRLVAASLFIWSTFSGARVDGAASEEAGREAAATEAAATEAVATKAAATKAAATKAAATEAPPAHLKTRTGTLTYPAPGNIDWREGTVECWARLGIEPSEYLPAQDYKGFVNLFTLRGRGAGLGVLLAATPGKDQPSWFLSISPDLHYTGFNATHAPFRKGEWHHIACIWKGASTSIYIDGRDAGTFSHRMSLHKSFEGASVKELLIGDVWNYNAIVTIDDFRLSRVARRPEELGFHGPLQTDVHTSILDPFDAEFEPDGKTLTRPAMQLAGEGGLAGSLCRFVPGKFGRALSFYKP